MNLGIVVLFCAFRWLPAKGAPPVKPLVEALIAAAMFSGITLVSALTVFARSRGLRPRAGEEPVCAITGEGVRVGDGVFWFDSDRELVKIDALRFKSFGPALVLTTRLEVSESREADIPVIVPLPDKPGFAAELLSKLGAELAARGFDLERSQDGSLQARTPTAARKMGGFLVNVGIALAISWAFDRAGEWATGHGSAELAVASAMVGLVVYGLLRTLRSASL